MDDKTMAELKKIIRQYRAEIKRNTPQEEKGFQDYMKMDIPLFDEPVEINNLASYFEEEKKKHERFSLSFKASFLEKEENYILLKGVKMTEIFNQEAVLFLPKRMEFFKKAGSRPVVFQTAFTFRPQDTFEKYSSRFWDILRGMMSNKMDSFMNDKEIKIPYYLIENFLEFFPHLCLNYLRDEIKPKISIKREDKYLVINTSDLKNWHQLGKHYLVYENEDNYIKILKSDYDPSGIFTLKSLSRNGKVKVPVNNLDINQFIEKFKNITVMKGVKEFKETFYEPKSIEAGIEFNMETDGVLYAVVEPIFDGKKEKDIQTDILKNTEEIRKILDNAENALLKNNFSYDSSLKRYSIFTEEHIYNFVKNHLQPLSKEFSKFRISTTDEFKKRNFFTSSIRIMANKEKEYAFSFDAPSLNNDEVAEILMSRKFKKKYFRLKTGDIVKLERTALEQMHKMLSALSVSNKEILSGVIVRKNYFEFFINNYNITEENCEDYSRFNKNLHVTLKKYQQFGVNWMLNLRSKNMGGVLADDMGLGKTIQALVYLHINAYINPELPSLVIMPKSVLFNWEDEIMSKLPTHTNYKMIIGNAFERKQRIDNINSGDMVLTTYSLLQKDIELYENISFDTLILDEAQTVKNFASVSSECVKKIKKEVCFALTGTPIENSLMDLWNIFDVVLPGYFGTASNFRKKYVSGQKHEMLKALINPFVLRRMKKDVEKELPEKYERNIFIDMEPKQRELYEKLFKEGKERFLRNVKIEPQDILTLIMRLRKICTYPFLYNEEYGVIGETTSGKEKVLYELIEGLVTERHRIILFSQFTSGLRTVKEVLKKRYKILYLDGYTRAEDRTKMVEEFNTGDAEIFMISLKAGGVGLNITGATAVIHYDPWWNPAVEAQATDRAYRLGQDKDVLVYNLIAKDSIEEYMYHLKKSKRTLSQNILTKKKMNISKEEITRFFMSR